MATFEQSVLETLRGALPAERYRSLVASLSSSSRPQVTVAPLKSSAGVCECVRARSAT